MDDGLYGSFSLLYDGNGYPTTLTATATGLTSGRPYRFYLVAINYVGESIPSNYLTVYACGPPTGFSSLE